MKITHPRFIVFLAALCLLAALFWRPLGPARAVAGAFDVAGTLYMLWMGHIMRRADADAIRNYAAQNDEGRSALLTIAVVVTGIILVTVGLELGQAKKSAIDVAFPVVTLILAWVFGNIIYTLHYAHLYYDKDDKGEDSGGLEFPHCDEPNYWDFAYFSFNLGMAYQVSDVQATSRDMRTTVMFHCIIGFFFNIGVLALTLNVVASAVGGGG